jgi:D-amino-acid oxidase
MNTTVIGCGVSGLSSAIRLQEAGHHVTIRARDLPPNTTSNIAAAIWHPYKVFPRERAVAWGQRSLSVFYELKDVPGSGVTMMPAIEVFSEPVEDPWWRECVPDFRRARPDELPAGFADGYVFETAQVETRIYLEYLMRRFREAGGVIEQRELASLDEALAVSDVVVNCAGLGARQLVGDDALYPIRGQIVRAARLPITRIMLDEDETRGVTYIVPRSTDCILGGTSQVGDWSLEPDLLTAASIIERCALLAPEVRNAQVLEHLVGLRPGRAAIRLEREGLPGGKFVVHNYGHGGGGVTLSWGCAEEVVALVGQE